MTHQFVFTSVSASSLSPIFEVGHKFGRWLDLIFMQRLLDAGRSKSGAVNVNVKINA